jgi:hypothetical protein
MDAREPAQPGTPPELHQHRLGLVIARVADGDQLGARLVGGAMERRVPEVARSLFQ